MHQIPAELPLMRGQVYAGYDFNPAAVGTDQAPGAQSKQVIGVIGVGYVGLHLVEAFAKFYEIVAYDISQARIEQVAKRFQGLGLNNVRCTTCESDLSIADALLISVPTSLNGDKTINITFLEDAVRSITENARNGVTVVMESSVAVGMTRELLKPLHAAKKVKIGMSPERVDAGRQFPAFTTIPKIISGIDAASLSAVGSFYEPVFDHLVPVSSLEVAEMTKLYENCQRMVCAAYANEMADACASLGISGWEVSKAAASKPFGYLPFQPGPGVGGHCIPVNPYYLLRTCDMPILQQATEASWQRPSQIASRLMRVIERKSQSEKTKMLQNGQAQSSDACDRCCCRHQESLPKAEEDGHSTRQKRTSVLVVGVAYKRGQSVLHHSPGVAVIQSLLQQEEAGDHGERRGDLHVEFADPLVEQQALPHVSKMNTSLDWNKEYLERFDGIIVTINQVGLDMDLLGLLDGVVVHDYCPRLD